MKQRFENLMGQSRIGVSFGTFHGIFFMILKRAYHFTSDNIITGEQRYQMMRDIISNYQLEYKDESEFIEGIFGEISKVKNNRIDINYYYSVQCGEEIFRKIFHDYQEGLKRKRLVDFDDMLTYTYELFRERKDILSAWQKKYKYILIDEFQDINRIQYEIIQMLALPENNLFIVGDDDQSIYQFRGAKPEIMLQFGEVYPSAKKVLLDINYRSTECIVRTAAMVIEHNKKRFPKNIRTENERGEEVNIREFENVKQQNEKVVSLVKDYQEKGVPLSEIAVLFRTNTQPRALIAQFMEANIPIRVKDQVPNIYEHWIAKNIIAYIKLAMGKRDRSLFLQVANRPKRYLSRQIFDTQEISFERLLTFFPDKKWMQERIEQWEYDLKTMEKMTPFAAINYIRRGIGYEEYLQEYAEYRHIKVEDLYDVLDELMDMAKPYRTYAEWFAHIENYARELEEQVKKKKEDECEDAVEFVTMHGSKGLEYEVVFIVDVNEGIIPHQKATLEEDLEEERRMFYVAMTRAKKELYIYFSKERYEKEQEMSRFLAELLGEE